MLVYMEKKQCRVETEELLLCKRSKMHSRCKGSVSDTECKNRRKKTEKNVIGSLFIFPLQYQHLNKI